MGTQILVVDHDEVAVGELRTALRRAGLDPVLACDRASAVHLYNRHHPSAVLVAVRPSGDDGRAVCAAIREQPEGALVPVLYMGAGQETDPVRTPGEALAAGGDYFFRCPMNLNELADRVLGWTGDGQRAAPSSPPTAAQRPAPPSSILEAIEADLSRMSEPPRQEEPSASLGSMIDEELRKSADLQGALETGALPLQAPTKETVDISLMPELDAELERERTLTSELTPPDRDEAPLTTEPVLADLGEDPGDITQPGVVSEIEVDIAPSIVPIAAAESAAARVRPLDAPMDEPREYENRASRDRSDWISSGGHRATPPESGLDPLGGNQWEAPTLRVFAQNARKSPEPGPMPGWSQVPGLPTPLPERSTGQPTAMPLVAGRGRPAGQIPFAPVPFNPTAGALDNLADVIALFVQMRIQRPTGVLRLARSDALVIVDGEPVGLRGQQSVRGLVALFGNADVEIPGVLLGNAEVEGLDRPVILGRRVVAAGALPENACTVLLARHLESGLAAALRSRGPWRFDADGSATREEIVPEAGDVRDLLAEALPRAAPLDEIMEPLGGRDAVVRIHAGFEAGARLFDRRFLSLLDGRTTVDRARQLSAIAFDRAAALSLVHVVFGMASVVPNGGAPRADERPQSMLPIAPPADSAPPPTGTLPIANLATASLPRLFGQERPPTPHPSLERLDDGARLRALADLVRNSDYFTILGVDSSASRPEVEYAYRYLRRLVPMNSFVGQPHLVGLAREILRSLEEARDVLSVPELRRGYIDHLKP